MESRGSLSAGITGCSPKSYSTLQSTKRGLVADLA
jgi:hypothetical protein